MTNKLYIALAAVALAGAVGVMSLSSAFAQEGGSSTFVQKLAQKLGISETKVQSAMNEIHTERHAEMQAKYEQELTKAVESGDITQAQKDAILAKAKELESNRQAEMESLQNMTPEQRRTAMEAKHEELKTWAEQNGVAMKYLPFVRIKAHGGDQMMGMGPGKMIFFHDREAPAVQAVPTQ